MVPSLPGEECRALILHCILTVEKSEAREEETRRKQVEAPWPCALFPVVVFTLERIL